MNLFSIESYEMYTEFSDISMFPTHTHDSHEIYCFLSGKASYSVEGNIYPLSPGDVVLVRSMEVHQLMVDENIPYHRIVIYLNSDMDKNNPLYHIFLDSLFDRPLGLYNHYPTSRYADSNWEYYMKKICHTKDPLKKQTYLMVLLQELTECFYDLLNDPIESSPNPLLHITSYIDRHLTEPLNLDIICNRFFISKSQLIRMFKKNLGSTVGEYINTKRLMLAQKMILSGKKPTSVYSTCGFNDYSSFYRAYKKKYGCGPATPPPKNIYT